MKYIHQLRPRKLTEDERSDRIILASDALNKYGENIIGAEGEVELAVGLVIDLLHLVEARGSDANIVASVALCMYNLERGTPKNAATTAAEEETHMANSRGTVVKAQGDYHTGGDRNSVEANTLYSNLVADALKDIVDAHYGEE